MISHEGDVSGIFMEFYTRFRKKHASIIRVEKVHGITSRQMLIANFTSMDRRREKVLALTYI